MNFRKIYNSRQFYFYITVFLAVSLPLSIYTTSIAEIALLVNWLLDAKFAQKWRQLKNRKAVFFLVSIYFLHILGLFYTEVFNYGYAIHDLKIKLPTLFLPIIFATSEVFSKKELKTILILFSLATLSSTLIGFGVFLGIIPYEYYDFRDISIFISNIRLSLMVNMSFFILLYYIFYSEKGLRIKKAWNGVAILGLLWFFFFLILLKSITGLFILVLLILGLAWYFSSKIDDVAPKFIIRVLVITIPLIIASFITHSIGKFYYTPEIVFSELENTSQEGNLYFHDTTRVARENGNYVWIYLCEKELRREWNNVSTFDYDGYDNKKQRIRYTLIRYLTSLGERKDANGIESLSQEDIRAIENGNANYIFNKQFGLYPRIYQITWEIDGYLHGGDPSGHSVAQRVAYLTAAKAIIHDNWLIGVGTGDVQYSFNQHYETSDSKLNENYRRRAHNQYITFILSFGIVGFVIVMLALFAPVFIENKWKDYLFMVFFIIGMVSMLNEDTLETQTGVSFFMFFYSLLMFSREGNGERKSH